MYSKTQCAVCCFWHRRVSDLMPSCVIVTISPGSTSLTNSAPIVSSAGQKDYEEASWKVFDAAYKALKNAPADADKATLESLTLALRNAQAALKKAETPAVALDAPKVKAAKAKQVLL